MSQILVFNVGSSSLKYAIYDLELKETDRGETDSFDVIAKQPLKPAVIGHRVVHGGNKYFKATIIDEQVLADLEDFSRLAPLHNPPAMEVARKSLKNWPKIPNVAVFDTAYYKDLPLFVNLYALPYGLSSQYKIRRYGFHGISHEYVAKEAAKKLEKDLKELKIITVHLGAGCSITAHKDGKAYDTSMGFTPLEGLMMASRSGDIDPGIIFYLARVAGLTLENLEEILNKKSGLLGVSGVSEDLPDILEKAQVEEPTEESYRCGLVLEMYAYRVKKYIGAYAAAMGGLDVLVFTGKIGERCELIREMITNNLGFLGDFKILVIPTNEELVIAKEVRRLISNI